MTRFVRTFAAAAGLAAAGCGSSETPPPAPVGVSGSVTLDGRPMADGYVYFKTPATGELERFEVRDGEFRGAALAGARRVEVGCNRGKMIVVDGAPVEAQVNVVDPAFNTNSKLTAEVTAEGPNRFAFEVKSK